MKDQKDFQPLHLEYTFQASATSVYDAWITKPAVELWLFKNETNQLYFEADLKEGGRLSVRHIIQNETNYRSTKTGIKHDLPDLRSAYFHEGCRRFHEKLS